MHACPLRSLELENFKSIASSKVEFNPLTVLVGMNSSGKSSLLQAVRLLSQIVEADKPGTEVPLNGTQVRLGTFGDARTSGRDGPISLKATLASATRGREADTDGLVQALTLEVKEPASRPERGHAQIATNSVEVSHAATLYLAEQWLRAIWNKWFKGYFDGELEEQIVLYWGDVPYDTAAEMLVSDSDLLTELQNLCGDERAYDLENRSFVQAGIRDISWSVACIDTPSFEEYLADRLKAADEFDENDPRHHGLLIELIMESSSPWIIEFLDLYSSIDDPDDETRILYTSQTAFISEYGPEIEKALREYSSSAAASDKLDMSYVDRARRTFYMSQEAQYETDTQESSDTTSLDQDAIKRVIDEIRERARERHTSEESYAIALSIAEAGGVRIQPVTDPVTDFAKPVTDFPKVARLFVEQFQDEPWIADAALNLHANRAMEREWRPAVTALLRERLRYLGPLRQEPRAFSDFSDESRPDVGAAGEHLARVLQWHATRSVDVPGMGQADLVDGLRHWLQKMGVVEDVAVEARGRAGVSVEVRPHELGQPVDLMSVGVGVSQVLPVLAVCLLAEPGDIVLLEQPELHLHPALQMRLADFLLACVESGRQIIVETHSEHLVNRLRRRVAEADSDDIGELVRIVFAERDDNGHTSFRPSDINPLGGLSEDWPDGFLDVGARDAQKLLQAGLAKHRRRGDE